MCGDAPIGAPPPSCLADCSDEHDMCGTWKDAGECTKNKGYMEKTCRVRQPWGTQHITPLTDVWLVAHSCPTFHLTGLLAFALRRLPQASCGVCTCGKAAHELSEPTRLTGVVPSALLRGGATVASLKAETARETVTPAVVEVKSFPPPPTLVPSVVEEEKGAGALWAGVIRAVIARPVDFCRASDDILHSLPLRAGAVAREERGLSEGASGAGATKAHAKRKGHRKADQGAGLWSHYVRGALQFVATAAFFGLLSEMHRRRGLKARKAAKEERARSAARAKKDAGDGEGKPPLGRQHHADHHGDDGVSDEDW